MTSKCVARVDVLAHAAIATRMVGKIAILCLVSVAAPSDDVNSKATAAQLVECRELARSKGRRDEARSMRQQQSQPLRGGCCMGANQEAIWRIGEVANQGAIEIRLLVDAGRRRDDVSIERRSVGCHYLGRYTRRDPPDHLDRHGWLQLICVRVASGVTGIPTVSCTTLCR